MCLESIIQESLTSNVQNGQIHGTGQGRKTGKQLIISAQLFRGDKRILKLDKWGCTGLRTHCTPVDLMCT